MGGQVFVAGPALSVVAQEPRATLQDSRYHLTDAPPSPDSPPPDDLADLNELLDADISQLATTDIVAESFSEAVTTVERQESTVGRTPAPIYVITSEMIRRSGVRTIPDALRLAPGVHVAQIDSNKWAISIRGFNGRFSNKLLVQIDGRTVYTPLFAGVFWDVQDVLLEDVSRIEVIRGPGSAMWGANAVNGVINILTKSSRETTGFFTEAGEGNERSFASARVGGDTQNGSWRFFTKWFDRDAGRGVGFEPQDDWELTHLGFRVDQQVNSIDEFTIQGDYYDGDAGTQAVFPLATAPFIGRGADPQTIAGGNILWRYARKYSADDQWALQFYYDQTIRHLRTQGFREDRHTVDVDFQRQLKVGLWHQIVWGMAYR
ncbi:MAG: TonB-dependent receptor, partial [Planctomycetota bacterium]